MLADLDLGAALEPTGIAAIGSVREVDGEAQPGQTQLVSVSDVALQHFTVGGFVFFWAMSMATGAPVEGVEISTETFAFGNANQDIVRSHAAAALPAPPSRCCATEHHLSSAPGHKAARMYVMWHRVMMRESHSVTPIALACARLTPRAAMSGEALAAVPPDTAPQHVQQQTFTEAPVTTDADGFATLELAIDVMPIAPDYSYDYGSDERLVFPELGISISATTPSGDRVFSFDFNVNPDPALPTALALSTLQFDIRGGIGFDRAVAAPGAPPPPPSPNTASA